MCIYKNYSSFKSLSPSPKVDNKVIQADIPMSLRSLDCLLHALPLSFYTRPLFCSFSYHML